MYKSHFKFYFVRNSLYIHRTIYATTKTAVLGVSYRESYSVLIATFLQSLSHSFVKHCASSCLEMLMMLMTMIDLSLGSLCPTLCVLNSEYNTVVVAIQSDCMFGVKLVGTSICLPASFYCLALHNQQCTQPTFIPPCRPEFVEGINNDNGKVSLPLQVINVPSLLWIHQRFSFGKNNSLEDREVLSM